MTKTPTPASHAVNTAPIAADLRGIEPTDDLHAAILNLRAWPSDATMRQFDNPAVAYKLGHRDARHAAADLVAQAAAASSAQQDAPAAQISRECLQQSAEPEFLAEVSKEQYARMFGAACEALGQISDHLGIDSDLDPGAEPIIEAIDELRAAALQAAPPAPAGVAVPAVQTHAEAAAAIAINSALHRIREGNAAGAIEPLEHARAALAAAPAQAVAVPDLDMDRVLSIADVHAEESREDGVRLLDRSGLVAFAKDVLREAGAPAQEHATQLAGQGREHRPNWLPFSVRTQIAARHGTKVTAAFNKLVRDVIETYIATHAAAPVQAQEDMGIPISALGKCWCTTCRPITLEDARFVVCPDCGYKRCPRAHNHELACTNSNAPGQAGSSWEHVRPASHEIQGDSNAG